MLRRIAFILTDTSKNQKTHARYLAEKINESGKSYGSKVFRAEDLVGAARWLDEYLDSYGAAVFFESKDVGKLADSMSTLLFEPPRNGTDRFSVYIITKNRPAGHVGMVEGKFLADSGWEKLTW